MVDLFASFPELLLPLLPRLLELLSGLVTRAHAPLAAVGVAAYVSLADGAGRRLSEEQWEQVCHMA